MSASAYAMSGVDISAGEAFAQMIKERVADAWPHISNPIGGFAGGITLPVPTNKIDGGADGSGTMAILAAVLERFEVLGNNAAAMSLMDVYANGSRPVGLFDVIDVAKLCPQKHIGIIDGIICACKLAGGSCVLLGGETAELPDMYKSSWMVNVNTTVIGIPDPSILRGRVKAGHGVYGWRSNGPASNGFSLIRRIFGLKQRARMLRKLNRQYPALKGSLGDALLQPAPVWINQIEIQRQMGVRFTAHAHITGGGMVDNIPRVLPDTCKVVINRSAWQRPPIFRMIEIVGKIKPEEMDRVFNQGIMVVSIVDPKGAKPSSPNIELIGQVEPRDGDEPHVQFTGTFSD